MKKELIRKFIRITKLKYIIYISLLTFLTEWNYIIAAELTENTFLIAELNAQNYKSERFWSFIRDNNFTGLEAKIDSDNKNVNISGSDFTFSGFLEKINTLVEQDDSKLVPVFLHFNGDIAVLDSLINLSTLVQKIFYLPQGETWPSVEYLIQANRRIIIFNEGDFAFESKILHDIENYALQIYADKIVSNSFVLGPVSNINLELFKVNNFDKLPTDIPPNNQSRNLVPDYINYLLENWNKYGKKPNFITVGTNMYNFDFIVDQINSFLSVKGIVKTSGKNLEKIYWKNPGTLVTGGKFSFPYPGGEEIILTPFSPGYKMTPEQIVVTGEMIIPESYSILAHTMELSEGLKASFNFDGIVLNAIDPAQSFYGENFSFVQDIDRGEVLKLPENSSINLGNPEIYGLPNSSFTVSCFVKFTEILEFGDNAILGNYETGYRRGLHLILRSGHPYFGLWANDFMSEKSLKNNEWYHLTWRYIIETGEQAIFLNGNNIGGSDGHPPYSGKSEIYVGSALSQGASLRGYMDNLYIWDRPLGNEEIKRLSLDEEIRLTEQKDSESSLLTILMKPLLILLALIIISVILWISVKKKKNPTKKSKSQPVLRPQYKSNQICLFGEFYAINKSGEEITDLFTPKVKELFLIILISTLKNGIGAPISEINQKLWNEISSKKVANNRAVTLNKLRKILIRFDKVTVNSINGYLQFKAGKTFFCDYIEAFKLCQIPEGMTRDQLESFFLLVKRGSFLKGIDWPWLDETRGLTGNQVIDNLLKLASIYQKETNLKGIEAVAQRILEYDDLNEEAVFLQIWALQKSNNQHLAKYNYSTFCKKYQVSFGEPCSYNFNEFFQFYSRQLFGN